MEQQEKLLTSIVVKLTKFRRPRQLRQGTIDRKGRNTICGCGSKKKYKKCCWSKGNAPGTALQSHLFFEEFEKQAKYAQKKYKGLTNDDSGALQESKV
jgi:hypothetical protein